MINMMQGDCMDLMKSKPDNYYDLAIVDPPYGIGVTKMTLGNGKSKMNKGLKGWDSKIPSRQYFTELNRVSANQIIWGANYMTTHLRPSMGWVFWDKGTGLNDFSDGELAFTSFDRALRKCKISWVGANANNGTPRIHPTEKPVQLYKWLLTKYAKEGDKILDTHGGSGSICIACHDLKFDLDWIELDEEYYQLAKKRYDDYASQLQIF